MAQTRIDHLGRVSQEETELLLSLFDDPSDVTIDDNSTLPPRIYRATGIVEDVWPLAWVTLTFVGASAALVFSGFLKSLGSEVGKRFIAHYGPKERDGKQPFRKIALSRVLKNGRRVGIFVPLSNPVIPDLAYGELEKLLEREEEKREWDTYIVWSHDEGQWIVIDGPTNDLGPIAWRGEENRYGTDPADY